jgi:hypothetical protein
MTRGDELAHALLYAVIANLTLPLAEADRATKRVLALIERAKTRT